MDSLAVMNLKGFATGVLYCSLPKPGANALKKLQVLGTGCPTCHRLAAMADFAARDLGIEFELEKVMEIDRILAYGVPTTPALVVDGEVRVVGRIPSVNELKDIIR
ncbi:MAG: hypothetical protein AMXMBFR84_44910 [Candidatus Hydrogenedentota bacterium]